MDTQHLRLTNKALKRLRDDHGIDLYKGGAEVVEILKDHDNRVKIYVAASGSVGKSQDVAFAEADDMTPAELMASINTAFANSFRSPGGVAEEAPSPKSE